jgi:hypothetical protein
VQVELGPAGREGIKVAAPVAVTVPVPVAVTVAVAQLVQDPLSYRAR